MPITINHKAVVQAIPMPHFDLQMHQLEKKSIETYPVTSYLLPFHLLPCDRQLPSQRLERALAQGSKGRIQIFLILFLKAGYLPDDFRCSG